MRSQVFPILFFCCNIHSIHGQNLTDIRLPPSIIKGPAKDIIFRSGSTVTLECKAEGIPNVTYEWKKNGIELNPNRQNIRKEADGTIVIAPATASYEGYYQCFAENQYGTAVSVTSHLNMAVLVSDTDRISIFLKDVQEGEPFHTEAGKFVSFPKATFIWEMELMHDMHGEHSETLQTSKRIQIADNGDLYFAYTKAQDEYDEEFYRCQIYNYYLDVKVECSHRTHLTVHRASGNVTQFAPTRAFASKNETVAIMGGSVTLRCFFSGNPEPTVSWTRPGNALPVGRYELLNESTEIVISNITSSDEGDYICTASNSRGQNQHSLQIRAEAIPTFRSAADGPRNVNVTEGESYTFNCNADAKPEAEVTWYRNGVPLDVENPPDRFVFSNDNKSLTIQDICLNCKDRESRSDLTVIQCKASNIHGYAFGSGYLNVLKRTEIMPRLRVMVGLSADMSSVKEFGFECNATSDPSTPPTVQWYKLDGDNKTLVHEDPPDVKVVDGAMILLVATNDAEKRAKYQGVYKCIADNGYSQAEKLVDISYYVQDTLTSMACVPSSVFWSIVGIESSILVILLSVIFYFLRKHSYDKRNVDNYEHSVDRDSMIGATFEYHTLQKQSNEDQSSIL